MASAKLEVQPAERGRWLGWPCGNRHKGFHRTTRQEERVPESHVPSTPSERGSGEPSGEGAVWGRWG